MKKSLIAVAGIAVVGIAGFAVLTLVGFSNDDGTPKSTAVKASGSMVAQNLGSLTGNLHKDIDELVGYGGDDSFASGDTSSWWRFEYEKSTFEKDVDDVQNALSGSGLKADDEKKIELDLQELKDLLSIADKHHDKVGSKALVYYHRISEDINYFVTGSGEEYGIANIQNGDSTVQDFINTNK
jgi:hypothetical protein